LPPFPEDSLYETGSIARARNARMKEVTAMSRQIPCPKCSEKLRTNSGLRWHLYHRHGWQDVQELLEQPTNLAKEAVIKEMELQAFAKGLGVEVSYLKQLIEKYFGKDAR